MHGHMARSSGTSQRWPGMMLLIAVWGSLAASASAALPSKATGHERGPETGEDGWVPPKRSTKNDIFKKWLGTWTCEGTAEGPQGTKTKYGVTWKWASVLGGRWYSAVYSRPRQGRVVAFEANVTVGYDRADKQYLLSSFDGFGG